MHGRSINSDLTSSMSNETVDLPSISMRLAPKSVALWACMPFSSPFCTAAMLPQEVSLQSL